LQTPAKLNAEKSETHVPDLPKAKAWLVHREFIKPQMNGANGMSDMEGKAAMVAASDPGGKRVSIQI
jgi:hypothetical protein